MGFSMQAKYNSAKIIDQFFRFFLDIKKVFFFLFFFVVVFPKIPLIPTGLAVSIRLEDILVFYLWILFLIYLLKDQIKIPKNLIFFWIGLYLFWALISTILGFFRGDVITPLFFLRKIEYISFFFFAYIITTPKNIAQFYKLVFISFWIVAIIGFLQYFRILHLLGITPLFSSYLQETTTRFWDPSAPRLISSTFDGNYDLGGYLILLIPFFQLLFSNPYYSGKWKIFLTFLSALALISLSGARAPTIIALGTVLLIFIKKVFFGSKKQIAILFLIFILLICSFFIFKEIIFKNFFQRAGNLPSFNFDSITNFFQDDRSIKLRADKWLMAWDGFLSHPVTGVGIGGFSFIAADGQHIQTLGETGFVGLILFFALFFYIIKMNTETGRYLIKIPLNNKDALNKIFIIALSIGILGLILDGIVINSFDASKIAVCLWTFIGISAKINSLYKQKNDQRSSA